MRNEHRILVVDDDEAVRTGFCSVLEANGFSVLEADGGKAALEIFRASRPAAVLLDLKMPGMNGMDTLRELRKLDGEVPVLVVTAYGEIDTAVQAVKLGAYDFLQKPPDIEQVVSALNRAVEKARLEERIRQLENNASATLTRFFGNSPGMRRVTEQILQVAWSDLSVIVQGETGTGKSLVARSIHNESPRATGPFITVDLGAIPESLVESYLFGHEKGAYTGAERSREGALVQAAGGTLFLDELQNIPLHVQAKLLRAVEEKRISPLGSDRVRDVDVRIIAATNMEIRPNGKEKKLREDLYYRLGEFSIRVPPLRERREDVLPLARRFMEEAGRDLKKALSGMAASAEETLASHAWPGNVRELKNVVRQAVLVARGDRLCSDDLRPALAGVLTPGTDEIPETRSVKTSGEESRVIRPLKETANCALRDVESREIRAAMSRTRGNKTHAAALLQIDYKTLLKKIRDYGLEA